MSRVFIFYAFVIVLAALLVLDMIWTGFLPEETSFKLIISIAIVGGVVLAVDTIRKEFASEKELKKDKYVD